MANIYDLSDTWNDGATTFTAIKMDVTDTASDASSLLMDLQVGGASKFIVRKDGSLGSNLNNKLSLFSGILNYTNNLGSNCFTITNTQKSVNLSSAYFLGWTSGVAAGNPDLTLARDAANTLAQRNSTNAQAFNLYNTYTDASNYERGGLTWNTITNTLVLEPQKAGTGVNREMWLRGVGGSYVRFKTDNQIDVSGGGGVNVSFKNSTTDLYDTPVIKAAETVATLPGTPEVGMIARVTDATAPAVGSTVTGGGATNALCWYNGTNWTVIGV